MVEEATTQLLGRAARGDHQALEELVGFWQPRLHGLFLGLGADPHQAEDLVQETLLRALEHLPRWQPRASFKTWLYHVALNLWRDQKRRAYGRHELLGGILPKNGADLANPPLDAAGQAEREAVRHALLSLPLAQREVLVLRFYQELSLEEIARACRCSANTVKSRLRLALVKLRRELEAEHAQHEQE